MAAVDKKMPLEKAARIAQWLVERLRHGCERAEVAGSVRRHAAEVGDIEIVCIPRRQPDLLGGEADSLLDSVLEGMVSKRHLVRIKGGDKYKQFHVGDADFVRTGVGAYLCRLDLFIVTPDTWGVQFVIRTGPADFSHRLVTRKSQRGLMPEHMRVQDGRLWDEDAALPTPEERDVFNALGLTWVDPQNRK